MQRWQSIPGATWSDFVLDIGMSVLASPFFGSLWPESSYLLQGTDEVGQWTTLRSLIDKLQDLHRVVENQTSTLKKDARTVDSDRHFEPRAAFIGLDDALVNLLQDFQWTSTIVQRRPGTIVSPCSGPLWPCSSSPSS